MLSHYKESLADLMNLLKIEPNNSAANKEVQVVKAAYRTVSVAKALFVVITNNLLLIWGELH